ncbi:PepSY domain-containing protein [Gordonia sp. HY002]|uniref:PepSY-associated TM helix domain-containing protein n=1 Tax=Gordonia zhenghanii TaxID=2911516 RepID=UPI001F46B863|nr:PepSY-associated TM helix domain-containing protein [Gordonia zhenghanii]MCF8570361.1 PepSY domain-containing protein [Gordonia zhenghanii]
MSAYRRAGIRMLHRLHFYAGVLVAPFLLVAAVTGALYALAPSIENVVYRDQLHTSETGQSQSLAAQVQAAQATLPDLSVSAVRPPADPGATTAVVFDDPTLGESVRRAVFVDPVTARTLGDLPVYGSAFALPVRQWLDHLHRDLHLGDVGRLYSELAASWLWVITLAGVALWCTRAARTKSRRRKTGRARTIGRHQTIGVWVAVGLLFLSATGLTWSTYAGEHVTELRSALNWSNPTTDTALSGAATTANAGGEHAEHGGAMSMSGDTSMSVAKVDAALALARSAGVGDGVEITLPADASTAFTVTEVRRAWQFSPDAAAVDPATDTVVSVNQFADWPVAAKLATWGIALHMGLLFGIANQIALFVLMLALITIIVLGYRSWYQRHGRRSRVGKAPTSGGLRDAPIGLVLVIIAVAVALGWFLPLLGWPLLAFVVVDAAAGLYRSRRTRHPTS